MAADGCFITLEGLDGAGKSTHIPWIEQVLRDAGVDLIRTREPGGTPLGETLRELLLREPMDVRTEALLMFAARNEHWRACIRPALGRGQWVLCDRYMDASYAYQGGGRALGSSAIADLERWLHQERVPDCTLLFDVPLEVARTRLAAGGRTADRFEQEDAAFFQRTRAAYLARVAAQPARFHVIDASGGVQAVQAGIAGVLRELLRSRGFAPGTAAS